jgi:hypothetical protein
MFVVDTSIEQDRQLIAEFNNAPNETTSTEPPTIARLRPPHRQYLFPDAASRDVSTISA